MQTRWLPALAILALAGCGYRDAINPPVGSPTGYNLYLQGAAPGSDHQVSVINLATGQKVRQLPMGTPSPDWSRLYTIVDRGQRSGLQVVDPRTGGVIREIPLDGRYELPPANYAGAPGGLSENGDWLVLHRRNTAQTPSSSHFLVVHTRFEHAAKPVDLDGDFAFDAITNDGRSLYLVEYMSSDSTLYRVRMYHVRAAYLDERIIVDKTSGALAMSGVRLTSLPAKGGGYEYSLYVNGRNGPFIHALDTANGFALCLRLPRVQSTPDQERLWSEAMTADGGTLYVVNGSLGLIVQIDSSGAPRIMRTSRFTPSLASQRPATTQALITPDSQTLFTAGDKGVIALELPTMNQTHVFLPDVSVDSLMLSPDGGWLFAVNASRGTLFEVNSASGALAGQLQGMDGGSSIFRAESNS